MYFFIKSILACNMDEKIGIALLTGVFALAGVALSQAIAMLHSYIAFVVDLIKFSEHQVVLADHAEFNYLVQFAQEADNPGVFLVGLVVVVALNNSELGNRLGIDKVGEKSEPPRSSQEFIMILAGGLADHPQAISAMLLGDIVIGAHPLLDNGSSVIASIGKFLAVDFEKETQSVFVDVHGYIDNIIKVDFMSILRNFHYGFSFVVVDSTGYELDNLYCTSTPQGEAFLLAA